VERVHSVKDRHYGLFTLAVCLLDLHLFLCYDLCQRSKSGGHVSSTAAVGLRSSRNNIGTLDARLNIFMYSPVSVSVVYITLYKYFSYKFKLLY